MVYFYSYAHLKDWLMTILFGKGKKIDMARESIPAAEG